jgi:hypothetical protein
MKHKLLGTIILCIAPLLLFAQYKNNTWLVGYTYNPSGAPGNGSKLIFNPNNIDISYEVRSMKLSGCYSGLSASDDSWFVYTNGSAVCNKNNDTLINGFDLSPGGDDNWRILGMNIAMTAVILPSQNYGSFLYLLHQNKLGGSPTVRSLQLYYSKIDPTGTGGGNVYLKNQVLIDDTIEIGGLVPCRHANGRDWWVLVRKFNSNQYYTILVTPDEISVKFMQTLPEPITFLGGQRNFSPNGEYFASFDNASQLRIYDFDRCTGILSNFRYKYITPLSAGALSFSPNSRFLYVSKMDTLWQFDMQAPDVLSSQTFIAEYDGFIDTLLGFGNGFWYHWNGPDGKVYMSATSTSRVLHVINNPDVAGQACNFQQHSVYFPTFNNGTTPTYVNLELFEVPNSVCDSLDVGGNELKITNNELKIMPNPCDGKFNIEFKPRNKSGTVYIYDVNGSLVYSEYVSPFTTIKNFDLQNVLSNGLYAISLVTGSERVLGKLIVKKE